MHIQYDKGTRRNCPELTYCPVVKDQWDCVLNDLEELGDKEFLVLMEQYIIEIFSCCLRLLPSCASTYHQTKIENAQICSEDHLSVSRIPLHLLLEVIVHAEEEYLVFLPLGTLDRIELLVQYQSIFLSRIGTVLVDEQAVVGVLGFALAFDRLAKASTFDFTAKCSNCISEVSCSLLSYSLSTKSVTNFFNP